MILFRSDFSIFLILKYYYFKENSGTSNKEHLSLIFFTHKASQTPHNYLNIMLLCRNDQDQRRIV